MATSREMKNLGETPVLKKRTRSQVQKEEAEERKRSKKTVKGSKVVSKKAVKSTRKSKNSKKPRDESSMLQLRDSSPTIEEVEAARALVIYSGNEINSPQNVDQATHAESLNSSETLHSKDTSKDSSRTVTNQINLQDTDEIVQDSEEVAQESEKTARVLVEVHQASEGSGDSTDDVFPPLPEIEIRLSTLKKKKVSFDAFSRKATCQFNQKKLEEKHEGFWTPKDPPFSERFLTEEGSIRYDQIRTRKVLKEKVLSSAFAQNRKLIDLLRKNGLLETVQDLETYSVDMVMEFYANFEVLAENKDCLNFVFVRGKLYEFSPRFVNHVLGTKNVPVVDGSVLHTGISEDELISVLTDGKLKHWHPFSSIFLAEKFKSIFGICCINWLPSSNTTYVSLDRAQLIYMVWKKIPVNFGRLIFDEVAKVVVDHEPGQANRRKSLRYPSLISKVLYYQKEIPLFPNEKVMALKNYKVDKRVKGSVRSTTKFCLNCANRANALKKRLEKLERLADKWAGC